jgi:hypothetical protein
VDERLEDEQFSTLIARAIADATAAKEFDLARELVDELRARRAVDRGGRTGGDERAGSRGRSRR